MNKLLEKYNRRLAISESVYAREHEAKSLSDNQKLVVARLLDNTAKFLNESLGITGATQRTDIGNFRKFCLDITTLAVPNMIGTELVLTKPMSAINGFIQYMKFVAGSTRNGMVAGETLINDPFRLGAMTDERVDYTSERVVETFTVAPSKVAWTPCVAGAVKAFNEAGEAVDGITVTADGTLSGTQLSTVRKVAYVYDNVVIPQNNIPCLTAHMEGIVLEAKARRISIQYSQMAAFQLKTEVGTDLGELLATQACAELTLETDTEIIKLLNENAGEAKVKFNKTLPTGVSKRDHYAGFAEILEQASQIIYDRTQKHAANYIVIASNIKPILAMMDGYKAASSAKINGPFFAGTLNNVKVYVSPAIKAGRFFLGFNGDDLATSAAVYAPYMPLVPTSLLGLPDGSMSQGFSSMYDLKMLNADLLVAGEVVEEAQIVFNKVVED